MAMAGAGPVQAAAELTKQRLMRVYPRAMAIVLIMMAMALAGTAMPRVR